MDRHGYHEDFYRNGINILPKAQPETCVILKPIVTTIYDKGLKNTTGEMFLSKSCFDIVRRLL